VVRDGIPFVAVPLVLAIAPLVFGYWLLALVLVAVAAFMAFFFRDPRRVPPEEPGIIVAPADGRITLIKRSGNETPSLLISIFLSPFDVHINRSPIAGKITGISYAKGKFLSATSDRASLLNEQNTLTIEGEEGLTVYCKQIAGVLARRIVCWKNSGDVVGIGEPFGMIKFGSRTDLTVTFPVELLVKEGMRVRAGETPIARLLR
jgi:phosphatidylserine decarboxylase